MAHVQYMCFNLCLCSFLFNFFGLLSFLDNDCLLSGSHQAVVMPLTSSCVYQVFIFCPFPQRQYRHVTYENYTTKVIFLQIWTENNFVVTLISYMKQPMVIYPVILHGDTGLPPACLISKLWLWCFKLYTQHYVFIHTLQIIQKPADVVSWRFPNHMVY